MYLPIEVSLDWCYNKIASRFKWELTTAFTKGWGLVTATEMWLQK